MEPGSPADVSGKNRIAPGLVRPRLLSLRRPGSAQGSRSDAGVTPSPVGVSKLTSGEVQVLPIKITDDDSPSAKKPLRINITDQVVAKAPQEQVFPRSQPKLTLGSIRPILTSKAPVLPKAKLSTVKISGTIKAGSTNQKKPVKKPETSDKTKTDCDEVKDIAELLAEKEAAEGDSNSDEDLGGPGSSVAKSSTNPHNISAFGAYQNSSFRILSERTTKKQVLAPPDPHPVNLEPIIIAGFSYFICHENQCLYSIESEEKIGTILADRSIIWYTPSRKTV